METEKSLNEDRVCLRVGFERGAIVVQVFDEMKKEFEFLGLGKKEKVVIDLACCWSETSLEKCLD